jgi:hypothetical protein
MQNSQLNEGLRPLDLKNLIKPIFEVDTFRSKMGEDDDVCVVSFTVKDRNPAKDLMEFIEKGYNFVLDADVSAGENNNGEYAVFVEIARTPRLSENIRELTLGIKRLSGIDDWKFRYYKSDKEHDADENSLRSIIPETSESYKRKMNEVKTESVKQFFNKTLMDDLSISDSIITIHKPFDQKISLRWLNEDNPQAVVEGATDIDTDSAAEIFWLTKVLGDYNISKFGDKFLFTNGDRTMLLQRTDK